MATFKMRADNIDSSLPIAKKTTQVTTECSACHQYTQLKIEATGNEYAILAGSVHGKCGNRKCMEPIIHIFTVTLPKGK